MGIDLKTLSEINRQLGTIEGAACCAPTNCGNVICNAVQVIDELLQRCIDPTERMEDDGK